MQKLLAAELEHYQVPALYLTDPKNIFYVTGFQGSFGIAIVLPLKTILVTDSRYIEEAKTCCKNIEVLSSDSEIWQQIIHGLKRIAFESTHMTVNRLERLKQKFNDTEWIASSPIIEKLRQRKNAFEVTAIRQACRIGDQTLEAVVPHIQAGDSELEVAWKLEQTARELGAECLSFPAIVAFEENSAIPHHQSGNRKLQAGDTVLIDFGVKYHNYCSDMTRTYFYKYVDTEKEIMYQKVLDAQALGKKEMHIGKATADSYNTVNEFFKEDDLDEFFTHSLGHGVGLNVHENPSSSPRSGEFFNKWDTITCEPGLYFPGKFGIRIEDLCLITENGLEDFTKSPKKLTVL